MLGHYCVNIEHQWRCFLPRDKTGEFLVCRRCGKTAFIDKRQSDKLHRWFKAGVRWPQITLKAAGEGG